MPIIVTIMATTRALKSSTQQYIRKAMSKSIRNMPVIRYTITNFLFG